MTFPMALLLSVVALFAAWSAIALAANLIDAEIVWDPPGRLFILLGGLSLPLALLVHTTMAPGFLSMHDLAVPLLLGCLGIAWLFVRLHGNPLEWSMVPLLFIALRCTLGLGGIVAQIVSG